MTGPASSPGSRTGSSIPSSRRRPRAPASASPRPRPSSRSTQARYPAGASLGAAPSSCCACPCSSRRRPMRPAILIVDDELRLAEVLGVALEGRGLEAHAVDSVAAAEALMRTSPVDLVLTDLRMPEAGGRELLQRLRATRPEIPVVIMTAYA